MQNYPGTLRDRGHTPERWPGTIPCRSTTATVSGWSLRGGWTCSPLCRAGARWAAHALHLFRNRCGGRFLLGVGTAGFAGKRPACWRWAIRPAGFFPAAARAASEKLSRQPESWRAARRLAGRLGPRADGRRGAPAAPEKKSTLLVPNEEVRLEGQRHREPRSGARFWVRHTRGLLLSFLGMIEPPLRPADGLVPLSGPGWLVAREEDTGLLPVTTEAALAEGQWPAGPGSFSIS